MSQGATKFVPRAVRYTLRGDDDQLIRFAGQQSHNVRTNTRFLNISISGLAFVTKAHTAPRVGELLKVEFPVPGGDRLAWFARVIRVEVFQDRSWWLKSTDEENSVREVVVAIRFHDFSEAHKNNIAKSLSNKYEEIAREQRLEFYRELNKFLRENAAKIGIFILCCVLTFAVLFLLSRPSANYDAKRGAPWGQRFTW